MSSIYDMRAAEFAQQYDALDSSEVQAPLIELLPRSSVGIPNCRLYPPQQLITGSNEMAEADILQQISNLKAQQHASAMLITVLLRAAHRRGLDLEELGEMMDQAHNLTAERTPLLGGVADMSSRGNEIVQQMIKIALTSVQSNETDR